MQPLISSRPPYPKDHCKRLFSQESPASIRNFLEFYSGDGCEINPLHMLNLTAEDYCYLKNRLLETVLPENEQDARVPIILDHAMNELNIYEPQLRNLAVAGILYGSLYFGDPSNTPDIDLILAYCSENDNPNDIIFTIHHELQKFSEQYLFCGFTSNLDKCRKDVEKMIKGKYWMAVDYAFQGSCLLMSRVIPLDFCDTEQAVGCIEYTQIYINEMALQYPFLRAGLILEFYNTWSQRFKYDRPVRSLCKTTEDDFFEGMMS